MKDLTNYMCIARGLSVAVKGTHSDGRLLEEGEIVAWSKDKYKLMADDSIKSYVADCGRAVLKAKEDCCSKEGFIEEMAVRG